MNQNNNNNNNESQSSIVSSSSSSSSNTTNNNSNNSNSDRKVSNSRENAQESDSDWNCSQLTPISAAIQKSFYNTKKVIDKAHLDYLNRIMETKASLSCELKDDSNKK